MLLQFLTIIFITVMGISGTIVLMAFISDRDDTKRQKERVKKS